MWPYRTLQGSYKSAGEGLLAREWRDRTTGNGFKLTESRVRWAVRKKFFPVRVVRPWNRLSRETYCPIPGSVEGQVGQSLEEAGLVKSVPACGRGVELDGL